MKIYLDDLQGDSFVVEAENPSDAIYIRWQLILYDLRDMTPRQLRLVGDVFSVCYSFHLGCDDEAQLVSSCDAYARLYNQDANIVHDLISRHNSSQAAEKFFAKVLTSMEKLEGNE